MIYQSEKTTSIMRALNKFRAKGVAVYADSKKKITDSFSTSYADRTNLIQSIQEPLIECKLEVTYTTEYHDGQEFACVTITHTTSGQFIKSYQRLVNVEPVKKSKRDGTFYIDYVAIAEETQKQKTYHFRTMTLDMLMISTITKGEELRAPQDLSKRLEKKPVEETQKEASDNHESEDEKQSQDIDLRGKAILEFYIRSASKLNKPKAKKYAEVIGGKEWFRGIIKAPDKVDKLEKVMVKNRLICDINSRRGKGGKNGKGK